MFTNAIDSVYSATDKAWDNLISAGVSEETLQVATCLDGYNIDTLCDIEFILFGTRGDVCGSNDEEEEEED